MDGSDTVRDDGMGSQMGIVAGGRVEEVAAVGMTGRGYEEREVTV